MKKKYTKIKSIILIFVEIFIIWQLFLIQNNVYRGIFEETITSYNRTILIRNSQYTDLTGHPIDIDEKNPVKNWSYTAENSDWCSGSGTVGDPYIIEDVYIDGQGTGYLVQIRHSTADFIIRDCIFTNGYRGIYLYNVSNGELNHNNCSFNSVGMYIYECDTVDIIYNTVNNNSNDGIFLEDYSFSFIDGNDVNYNGDGINSYWSVHNNSITFNSISFNNYRGIEIRGGDNYIQYNTVNNNGGNGIVSRGYRDDISHNDANNNEGYGIHCYYSHEANIEENTANFNGLSGIYIESANCTIWNNNANYNKEAGIYITDEGHDLIGNQLDGCGLYIYPSDKVTMSSYSIATSNTANGKIIHYRKDVNNLKPSDFVLPVQIFLVNCNNSIIRNFDLSNVSSGILLFASHNNNISENHLNYNSLQGIYVKGHKNNITDNDIKNGGSLYVSGSNCSILRNNVSNGGEIYSYSVNIAGGFNNISKNIINYGSGMKISGTNATVLLNTIYNCSANGLVLDNTNYATVMGNDISYCMGKGIDIRTSNSEIMENTINNCLGEGISLTDYYDKENNSIVRNSINNNLHGIFLSENSELINNNISHNTLKNNKEYGIYMSSRSYDEHKNTIVENKMYGCGFGIKPTSLNNLITNDTIDSTNLVNDKPLYLYYHKVSLDESNFTNAGQIILINCSNSLLKNLNFNNGSVGITLYHCDENEISDVTSENNKFYGIHLYSTDNTIISNSNLNHNGKIGLDLSVCDYISVTDSDFNNNMECGISLSNCDDNTITGNTINDNEEDGLYMSSCSNVNYTSNYFVRNQFGITLDYACTENYFEMNTIHNNTDYGLRILYTTCNYNEFYENSFNNPDGINACDNGSANGWYYRNYWHDYPGKDADDDGIGDTPYHINGTANAEDTTPIWWDPPVLTVYAPLENSEFISAPNFAISIIEGVNDTIWYTLNSTEKIFFYNLNGSIDQNRWNQIRDGNIKIIFFVNDSRGFIDYKEVNVIKTSEMEIPIGLIILISILSVAAVVGIAITVFFLKRTKGKKE